MNKKKIVVILIALLMIPMFFSIQGTFAKYKSTVKNTDNARVAKWNVNVDTTIDLFKDSYITGVKSLNNDKVVAPGTEGEYTFTISGAPETNYKLSLDAVGKDDIGRILYDFDDMCPTTDIDMLALCILSTFSTDVVYPANQPVDYDTESGEQMTHTIRWRWLYEEGEDKDLIDSLKGKNAIVDSNNAGYQLQDKVQLTFKIVAEQTDEEANNE